MDLLEYQGKALFLAAGLPAPRGWLARDAAQAEQIAASQALPLVVKAQVRAGGRGKAGGIAVTRSREECAAEVSRILALTVKDKPVEAVLLEEAIAIERELYFAITLSRHDRAPMLLFSTRGGMDIEQVARETPEALLRAPLDPLLGLKDYQVRDLALAAGLRGETAARFGDVARGLWHLYRDLDATLVEVNPLVVTGDGAIVCLDSKITIDDNALWRHPDLVKLRDSGDAREREAREAGLHYLSLDGDIGVLGNGAGMVMSTLDLIDAAGGRAADFCDVGGGAQAASVAAALRIITGDDRVRVVLVSIFGGITRGDEVARGVIAALGEGGRGSPPAGRGPPRRQRRGPGPRPARRGRSGWDRGRRGGRRGRGARGGLGEGGRMSIIVSGASRVLVQGVTGREGAFHTRRMLAAGTNVVAGTSPGKAGQTVEGVPVFDAVADAVRETGADVAVLFVPARFALDALLEAADGGVRVAVCITEGIPVRDMTVAAAHAARRGMTLVGPNGPGIVSVAPPGERGCNAGIMPADVFASGPVGLVSRSGTLTYEIVDRLTKAGLGQTTCIGMGGDPVHGVGFLECLEPFEADPATQAVVLVGEIGGDDEERAAAYVAGHMTKPVVAYLAGFTAPPGKTMGHAGAIISGGAGTAAAKAAALEAAGVAVARRPSEVAALVAAALSR